MSPTQEQAPAEEVDRPKSRFSTKGMPKVIDTTTAAFHGKYEKWTTERQKTFPESAKAMNAESFSKLIAGNPDLPGHLAREIATLLAEYDKDGIVNEDPLWPHQKALIIEFMESLVTPGGGNRTPDSFLLEEAPGTGKTRIMGFIMQAISRLMIRGLFEGNVLYIVKRKSVAMQQTMSPADRREAVMTTSNTLRRRQEAREQFKYVERMFLSYFSTEVVTLEEWAAFSMQEYESVSVATRAFRNFMHQKGVEDDMNKIPEIENVIEDIGHLMARQGGVINAPLSKNEEYQVLRLGSKPDLSEKSGDFLFGVDQQLIDGGHVYIQSNFELLNNDAERPDENTRIAVLARTTLNQDRVRSSMKGFLKNVQFIFVDEAGLGPDSSFANMVTSNNIGGKRSPHVLAATAWNRRGRLRYRKHLSTIRTEDAVNSKEKILRAERLNVFPPVDQTLFPSGSIEAAEQLIAEYQRKLLLPKKEGVKGPTDGHHIIAVDRNIVPYVIARLQSLNTGAQIVSCDDNRDERYSAIIQAAMNDPSAPPVCLVGAPESVIDSFDFKHLQSTWLCANENKADNETLTRLFGRQFHSQEENGYVVQQRFSNSVFPNSVPWNAYQSDIDLGVEQTFGLVPGQFYIGKKACRNEAKAVEEVRPRQEDRQLTHTGMKDQTQKKELAGTYPLSIGVQRASGFNFGVRLPKFTTTGAVTELKERDYINTFAKTARLGPEAAEDLFNAVQPLHKTSEIIMTLRARAYHWRASSMELRNVKKPKRPTI